MNAAAESRKFLTKNIFPRKMPSWLFHYTWRAPQLSFLEVLNSFIMYSYFPICTIIYVRNYGTVNELLTQSLPKNEGAESIRENKMPRKPIWLVRQLSQKVVTMQW